MKKQAEYWLKMASDDLSVIEEIIEREDLTHMVAFHSQQAIEKSLKAILEEKESKVPRTHNLIALIGKVKKYLNLRIEEELIAELNETYIDSRYPTDLGLLPGGKPPLTLAKDFFSIAHNVFKKVTDFLSE